MCNHYHNIPEALPTIESWREFVSHFNYDDPPSDMYPKRQGVVVRMHEGETVAETMHWGFPWIGKGKRPGTTKKMNTTNVRNHNSPLFRGIINQAQNRCLVPFTEFAEPRVDERGTEAWFAVLGEKIPAFAGIWRDDAAAGPVFAFLTSAPNPLVAQIHPKAMPVILHREDYSRWLEGAPAQKLASPFPSQLMSIVR